MCSTRAVFIAVVQLKITPIKKHEAYLFAGLVGALLQRLGRLQLALAAVQRAQALQGGVHRRAAPRGTHTTH